MSELGLADRTQNLIAYMDVLNGLAICVFMYLFYVAIQTEVFRERLRTLWALEGLWVWDDMFFLSIV